MLFILYQCPDTVCCLNTTTLKTALTELSQNNVDYEVHVRTTPSEIKIHISSTIQVMEMYSPFPILFYTVLGQNDPPFKVFYLMSNAFRGYKPLTC